MKKPSKSIDEVIAYLRDGFKNPDLEVIKLAIESIEDRRNLFCCTALTDAVEELSGVGEFRKCDRLNRGCSPKKYQEANNLFYLLAARYGEQFKLSAYSGEDLPFWWASFQRNTLVRLHALETFRDQCIKAAQETSQHAVNS